MGQFAADVAVRLRDALAERVPRMDWGTERYVRRTPVDVAGEGDVLAFVELEWRRADPANNTVKIARYADAGEFDRRIVLVQAFTRYYDLSSGGVSSKRENAAFVGRLAARTLDGFDYRALTLAVDPPARGGDRPEGWRAAVDALADGVATEL